MTGSRDNYLENRRHHAKKVKRWLEKGMVKHFLEVFFLHAYSPELNPDEYINGDLKGIVHSSPAIRSVKELKQRTRSSMRKLQRKPDQVRGYFRSKHIAYAA